MGGWVGSAHARARTQVAIATAIGLVDVDDNKQITQREVELFAMRAGFIFLAGVLSCGYWSWAYNNRRKQVDAWRLRLRLVIDLNDRNEVGSILFPDGCNREHVNHRGQGLELNETSLGVEWIRDRDYTCRLREALILYAHDIWVRKLKQAPADEVHLRMLDPRPRIKTDENGNTIEHYDFQRHALFLPRSEEISAMLDDQKASQNDRKGAIELRPFFFPLTEHAEQDEDGRFRTADMQLAIFPPKQKEIQKAAEKRREQAKVKKEAEEAEEAEETEEAEDEAKKKRKKKGKKKSDRDKEVVSSDDDDAAGSAIIDSLPAGCLYVDIYGKNHQDRLGKAQKLINNVMTFYKNFEVDSDGEGEPDSGLFGPVDHRPIHWIVLTKFTIQSKQDSSPDFPQFEVRDIPGTLEEHARYHESFFHPKKEEFFRTIDQFKVR